MSRDAGSIPAASTIFQITAVRCHALPVCVYPTIGKGVRAGFDPCANPFFAAIPCLVMPLCVTTVVTNMVLVTLCAGGLAHGFGLFGRGLFIRP